MSINVKIQDDIYRRIAPYFGRGRGKINRNAFINEALAFFARMKERRRLAEEFRRASMSDRKDPKLQAELRELDRASAEDFERFYPSTNETW
jgi:hypothetical protein